MLACTDWPFDRCQLVQARCRFTDRLLGEKALAPSSGPLIRRFVAEQLRTACAEIPDLDPDLDLYIQEWDCHPDGSRESIDEYELD